MTDQSTNLLSELIEEANVDYDRRLQERHDAGAAKYGPLTFFEKNTIEEAMEEVLDCSNYLRYTYIKLYLINAQLDAELGSEPEETFVTGAPDLVSGRPSMTIDKDASG